MFTTPFAFMAAPAGGGYDPDAQAYIDAVIAAGGTLSSPQQDAINTFYVDIKSDGIYSNLYFMHPFFGGNAASNAIEGINPGGSYDLDFNGSWTHGASGSYAAQNSSNYADTNFDLSTSGPSSVTTSWSFGYMMTNNDQSAAGYGYMGVGPGANYMIIGSAGASSETYFSSQVYVLNEAPQTGFINSTFRSASNAWISGALQRGSTASGGLVYSTAQTSTYTQPSTPTTIYYNKINPTGLPTGGNYLFAWGGQYLDSTQMTNFLVHLNTLQTAFNRQIFI